jgi:hypothetical protein
MAFNNLQGFQPNKCPLSLIEKGSMGAIVYFSLKLIPI